MSLLKDATTDEKVHTHPSFNIPIAGGVQGRVPFSEADPPRKAIALSGVSFSVAPRFIEG